MRKRRQAARQTLAAPAATSGVTEFLDFLPILAASLLRQSTRRERRASAADQLTSVRHV